MVNDERDANDQRREEMRKKSDPMAQNDNSRDNQPSKRTQDKALVQNLRELYQPVLDEPVPEQFLEILRRKRKGKEDA